MCSSIIPRTKKGFSKIDVARTTGNAIQNNMRINFWAANHASNKLQPQQERHILQTLQQILRNSPIPSNFSWRFLFISENEEWGLI